MHSHTPQVIKSMSMPTACSEQDKSFDCTKSHIMDCEDFFNTYKNGTYNSKNFVRTDCCSFQCTMKLSRLELCVIRSLIPRKSTDWIDYIVGQLAGFRNTQNQENTIHMYLSGHRVCFLAYRLAMGLSAHLFNKALIAATTGRRRVHGNLLSIKNKTKTQTHLRLLQEFVMSYGQQHPSNGKIVIDKRVTLADIRVLSGIPAGVDVSNLLLKMDNVSRTTETLMTSCNTCASLKVLAHDGYREKEKREQAAVELKTHYRMVMKERTLLEMLIVRSKSDPSVGVIMCDGCSKELTKLPSIGHLRGKRIGDVALVQCPLYAILGYFHEFSRTKRIHCYMNYGEAYSSNTNYIASIILDYLSYIQVTPRTLVIILDNARTNKSKLMFRFLGILVHTGIFEEVLIEFQQPGHTHNQADQFFSTVKKRWQTNEIWTYQEGSTLLSEQQDVAVVTRNVLVNDWSMFLAGQPEFSDYLEDRSFNIIRRGRICLRSKPSQCDSLYTKEWILIQTPEEVSSMPLVSKKYNPTTPNPIAHMLQLGRDMMPLTAIEAWLTDEQWLYSAPVGKGTAGELVEQILDRMPLDKKSLGHEFEFFN